MKKLKQLYQKHKFTLLLISFVICILSAAITVIQGLSGFQYPVYFFGAIYGGYLIYHAVRYTFKKIKTLIKKQ